MKRVKERELLRYVVATLDESGKTLYLLSHHGGKYDLVDKIEYATKLAGRAAAETFYEFAKVDFENKIELVLLPVIISYELIDETQE